MEKEQLLHDIALLYTLYCKQCDTPVSPYEFYQQYKRNITLFENIIERG